MSFSPEARDALRRLVARYPELALDSNSHEECTALLLDAVVQRLDGLHEELSRQGKRIAGLAMMLESR